MVKFRQLLFLFAILVYSCSQQKIQEIELKSPNQKLAVHFSVENFDGLENCLTYQVFYQYKTLISNSLLGFELMDGSFIQENFEIKKVSNSQNDETWKPVYGERTQIRDFYNQSKILVKETKPPFRKLEIIFRAYNEGVAFCFHFLKENNQNSLRIAKELTEFRFTEDLQAWATYTAQGEYEKVKLSQIKPECERPLTIEINKNLFAAVGEARLVDFARMKLAPNEKAPTSLVSSLSSEVIITPPYTTPWRVIMVAEKPKELLENNHIFLNLNDPCALKDVSWIKPGKVIREVTLTTQGGKACVDFAVEHNLQYVEYDAGWYGYEYSDTSDASIINVDPKRSPGPLNLREVIDYAEEKGIGILLYVNRRALEKQLDEILPLYQKWGIKGVKYGFVQVGSQKWTSWLHEAIRKAAENKLMVDVHDEYRPTGFSRTYPNFMTQEGIRGDEERPPNTQTLTILFSRMLAGAGDNTVCYFDKKIHNISTYAYQLAKSVCMYSPLQFLYWYDRPQASPIFGNSQPPVINNTPELEFFDAVPTVWERTKVLQAEIGEFAIIARKSGENWFIGCMNANQPREFEIKLDFLDQAKKYIAHIYSDDETIQTSRKVKIERFKVNSKTVLKAFVSENGGQAIRIVPAIGDENYPNYY